MPVPRKPGAKGRNYNFTVGDVEAGGSRLSSVMRCVPGLFVLT